MPYNIKARVVNEANYIIETGKTVREISSYFNVSKSTVHDDLSKRLKNIDKKLYDKVSKILCYHASVKHIRGGISTKLKYAGRITWETKILELI